MVRESPAVIVFDVTVAEAMMLPDVAAVWIATWSTVAPPEAFVVNVTVALDDAEPPEAAAKVIDGRVADPVTVLMTSEPVP